MIVVWIVNFEGRSDLPAVLGMIIGYSTLTIRTLLIIKSASNNNDEKLIHDRLLHYLIALSVITILIIVGFIVKFVI